MEKNERGIIELNWGSKDTGRFEAVLVNGELKHFMGVAPDGSINVYSNDSKFLQSLKEVLGELEMESKTQMTRLKNGGAKNAIPTPANANT